MNMKNLMTVAVAAALLAACNSGPEATRSITAQIDGGAGKMLYLDKFVGNKPVHVDSVVLDAEGKGVIGLPSMPLDFYALTYGGEEVFILLLDSAENVTFVADANSLGSPRNVEGSVNTDLLHGYFNEAEKYDKEAEELVNRLKADRNDTVALTRYMELNQTFGEYTRRFVREHKGSPAVLAAMNRLNIQNEMELFRQVKNALRETIPYSEYYAAFRDQVDRAEQQMELARQQEEQQAMLDNMIPVGSEAPDFTQNTPEGKPLSLSSLRGKVVLIDFWASWCRPCRMENPNVVKVYDKYHNKGFEILGVSLDRDRDAWLQAIEHDGLPWKHVSDLQFWNNAVAQQYGISSIPHTILLDREGKVLAKNLRGKALEDKLAEVFQ